MSKKHEIELFGVKGVLLRGAGGVGCALRVLAVSKYCTSILGLINLFLYSVDIILGSDDNSSYDETLSTLISRFTIIFDFFIERRLKLGKFSMAPIRGVFNS